MNDDDRRLRHRIQATNPVPDSQHPQNADWIPALVEAVMSTPTPTPTPTPTADTTPTDQTSRTPVRRWLIAAAAVTAVVAATVTGVILFRPNTPAPVASTMTLTMPGGDNSMMSCMPFSVDILAPMQTAFDGTAVEVTADTVVLEVSKWYRGGDAQRVNLTPAPGEHVSLTGSIVFEPGKRYLVTATDGLVNSCGFTQEWTPEGAAAFDQAFAS